MKEKTIFTSLIIIIVVLNSIYDVKTWGRQPPKKEEVKKDLYKLMELTKKATKEEIKKQYRKLTRKLHPDTNPNQRDLFTEVTEAYEILSDPKKRRIYDTKGYTAAKEFNPNEQNHQHDMFSNFFGGGRGENKNDDLRIKLKVSLKDLYNGVEFEYKYTRNIICPHCRGTGADSEDDVHVCNKCGGQGVVLERRQIAPGYIQQFQMQCNNCGGRGKIIRKECHVCRSKKIMSNIEDLSVYVEKGMKNGQEIVKF